MMGYLGFQDATTERLPITQSPGEWTRAIGRDIEGVELFVTVSQKKWDIVKLILESMMGKVSNADDIPDPYVQPPETYGAYPLINPFLKGLYLMMNSWREGIYNNWWKMLKRAYKYFIKYLQRSGHDYGQEVFAEDNCISTLLVMAMTNLYRHLRYLLEIFESK